MTIASIISELERFAPPAYQENYDNAGLLTGSPAMECTGVLCTLDTTEDVVSEAIEKKCNLIISHHPVIFSGLKKITGKNYIEKTIIKAIKNDLAIYAIHTNIDNVIQGVSGKMAEKLGLINCKILSPKKEQLMKLYTFVPVKYAEQVKQAIYDAGGGHIGNYSECSFCVEGTGSFKGNEDTNPFTGKPGERHEENELKIEIIFPVYLQQKIKATLIQAHPYEEPAYDFVLLANEFDNVGSGVIGELPTPLPGSEVLKLICEQFTLTALRHTPFLNKNIRHIALCGGSGSFLTREAIAKGADMYITADVKYHEFFDADQKLVLADIGHWESEQFTIDLLHDILQSKFPTFAIQKSSVNTNPVTFYINR